MSKQSIFGRVAQMAKANINALLDSAEDPEMMLDQMVRDYTNSIAEAQGAVAQTIGNLRMLEADYAEDQNAVVEWGRKALAASQKADEFRTAGNAADAEKFDNLAKVAIGKQMSAENEVKAAEPHLAAQRDVVEKLKSGLVSMKDKLDQLTSKRDELVARAKSAQAQAQVHDAVKSIDILDPTSEVSRFEDKIRREEARVQGQAELAASSLDAQFERLDDLDAQAEVEARLAELKASTGGGAAVTATPSAPALGSSGAGGSSSAYDEYTTGSSSPEGGSGSSGR
jgi:phage shock protein A